MRRLCLPGVYVLCGLLIGAAFGYFFAPQAQTRGFGIRESSNSYTYISPLLAFEAAPEEKDFTEFKFLEDKITHARAELINTHQLTDASIYFRSLNSGRWVGVNENTQYDGASLLKLATVIAYYKAAEEKPSLLTRSYVFSGPSIVAMQSITPKERLRVGEKYSAQDLIQHTLIYSDNDAVKLLETPLTPSDIKEVVTDLRLPMTGNQINLISPKDYAFLFRVLYSATYLSRPTSEALLKMLSQSAFTAGLTRGVPADVLVANKFGERTFVAPDNKTILKAELHDCGIIYYPKHPYFLCIMTTGNNFSQQTSAITTLSRTVYSAMDAYWKARAAQ